MNPRVYVVASMTGIKAIHWDHIIPESQHSIPQLLHLSQRNVLLSITKASDYALHTLICTSAMHGIYYLHDILQGCSTAYAAFLARTALSEDHTVPWKAEFVSLQIAAAGTCHV